MPNFVLSSIKVYDLLGNELATLVNGEIPSGKYEIEFDAKKSSSGIYIYRIKAGKFKINKKNDIAEVKINNNFTMNSGYI